MFLLVHHVPGKAHGVGGSFFLGKIDRITKSEHAGPIPSKGLQWLLSGLLDSRKWSRCATPWRGSVSPALQSLLPDAGELSLTIALHGCHVLLRPAVSRVLQAHPGQLQYRK